MLYVLHKKTGISFLCTFILIEWDFVRGLWVAFVKDVTSGERFWVRLDRIKAVV